MTQTIEYKGKTFIQEPSSEVEGAYPITNLSLEGLVKFYNTVTGEEIKKFSDKATGQRRVWNALLEATGVEEEVEETADKTPTPGPTAGAPIKRADGMTFNYDPKEEQKSIRPGSNRAHLLEMLKQGATFEELMAATWGQRSDWTEEKQRKTTYEGVRLIHTFCGYGLKTDSEGRITAYS